MEASGRSPGPSASVYSVDHSSLWTIYLIDELPVPVTPPPHHSAALRVEDDRVRGRGREKIHWAQHREAEPQPTAAAAAAGVNVLN